ECLRKHHLPASRRSDEPPKTLHLFKHSVLQLYPPNGNEDEKNHHDKPAVPEDAGAPVKAPCRIPHAWKGHHKAPIHLCGGCTWTPPQWHNLHKELNRAVVPGHLL